MTVFVGRCISLNSFALFLATCCNLSMASSCPVTVARQSITPSGNTSVAGETLAEYFFPLKPKFPPEGVKCECPNCKCKFSYEQNELRYER